jgi:hypothetical protein
VYEVVDPLTNWKASFFAFAGLALALVRPMLPATATEHRITIIAVKALRTMPPLSFNNGREESIIYASGTREKTNSALSAPIWLFALSIQISGRASVANRGCK